MAVAIAILAFGLRVWAPGPTIQTVDEFSWVYRSAAFRGAIVDGHPSRASTSAVAPPYATQPGVTTMWAGTLGHGAVFAAESVGLLPTAGDTVLARERELRAARGVVALWCSLALGLLVIVSSSLVGRRAAIAAGLVLVTEPWLVGHSNVLHTDAMVTMFGALSIVALAAACRDGLTAPRTRLLVVSGVTAALAVLTKLNAVPLVFGGAAVILLASSCRRDGWAVTARRIGVVGAAWFGIGVVTFVAVWPALWVDPLRQLGRLLQALDQLELAWSTYFRYRVTDQPGPTYYVYALALRLSPWLFLGATVAVLATLVRLVRRNPVGSRSWPARPVLAMLLFAPVPYVVTIAVARQKYDRYVLPVMPFLALLAGVVVAVAVDWWVARRGSDRLVRPLAVAATAVLAVTCAAQAPYAISHANPLLGGQERARNNIQLGWGEGMEALGQQIAERERGHCDDVRIHFPIVFFAYIALPCGHVTAGRPLGTYDYVIRVIATVQRREGVRFYDLVEQMGTLVDTVEIGGVPYAELWYVGDR